MIALLVVALVLAGLSGVPAALGPRTGSKGERVAVAALAVSAALGLPVALWVGFTGRALHAEAAWSIPCGALALRVDALSAMFLVPIFAIAPLAAAYGLDYWPQREHPRNGRKLRLFYGLLVASMGVLVIAHDSILFLMGWEGMALAAFMVLTTADDEPDVRAAGFVYLVATRIGTLALFAMFAVLRHATGAWRFEATALTSGASNVVFVLALIGCLLKAGAMPLHVWLPGAHANAPSHVSALMSGVLIKMGIYGLLRVTSFFPRPPLWWGETLFFAGVLSAVLGVAFALGQHDLKRLLAYHSVENIGIILMGLGVAVVGRAEDAPAMVGLGVAGALLHVWNHGLFKALLFLSAGSVVHATGTRTIDALGGLQRRMPVAAGAFLLGAVAICGLPPLNGFVSELLVYLGLLDAALARGSGAFLVSSFGLPALALVGALALACFVKAFGAVFLGSPRSEAAARGHDASASMVWPMAILGGLCVLIGLAPGLVMPMVLHAAADWAPEIEPARPQFMPWVSGLAVGLLLVVGVALWSFGRRVRTSAAAPTWDCGYARPTSRMQYTASSFAEMLVGLFAWALRPVADVARPALPFPARAGRWHVAVPDPVLDRGVLPALRHTARGLVWFRWIQHGHIHLYLLYVLAAVLVTLVFFR